MKFLKAYSLNFPIRLSSLKQIRYLTLLRHPNILRLVGFCTPEHDNGSTDSDHDGKGDCADTHMGFTLRALVYLKMPNGSLEDRLACVGNTPPLTARARLRVALGVARGLAFMHQYGITHRDIKPGNILLDAQLHPKIGDFGVAVGPKRTHNDALWMDIQDDDETASAPARFQRDENDSKHGQPDILTRTDRHCPASSSGGIQETEGSGPSISAGCTQKQDQLNLAACRIASERRQQGVEDETRDTISVRGEVEGAAKRAAEGAQCMQQGVQAVRCVRDEKPVSQIQGTPLSPGSPPTVCPVSGCNGNYEQLSPRQAVVLGTSLYLAPE